MFEPINARFASSCSRNGMSAAATDTNWCGATSISVISPRGMYVGSPYERQGTRSFTKRRFSSSGSAA